MMGPSRSELVDRRCDRLVGTDLVFDLGRVRCGKRDLGIGIGDLFDQRLEFIEQRRMVTRARNVTPRSRRPCPTNASFLGLTRLSCQ